MLWRLLRTLNIGMIYLVLCFVVHKICDSRISAVPPFPGLCWFADGRDFKQWTGNDSKALMKVHACSKSLI